MPTYIDETDGESGEKRDNRGKSVTAGPLLRLDQSGSNHLLLSGLQLTWVHSDGDKPASINDASDHVDKISGIDNDKQSGVGTVTEASTETGEGAIDAGEDQEPVGVDGGEKCDPGETNATKSWFDILNPPPVGDAVKWTEAKNDELLEVNAREDSASIASDGCKSWYMMLCARRRDD